REVAASVDECAHRLAALGVKAGDCIAMLSPPRPEAMITLLAAARLGAVWVGLNPRYRIREMAYVIGHARPALIVSVKGFEERDYAADLDEAIAEVGDAVRPATVFFDGDGVSPAALLAALAQGKPLAEAPDELPDVDPTAPCMLV